MRILLKKNNEDEAVSYDIPVGGMFAHSALGNWDLQALPKTPNGKIRLFLWDPEAKPDLLGRVRPVRSAELSFSHPEVRFRKGLFGWGGTLTVSRSLKPVG